MLEILERYGHADIEEIYNEIKEIFISISLATVYKNINTMLEAGLIQEIKIPNGKSKFEIVKEHHSHFFCTQCNRIYDIPHPQRLPLLLPDGFVPKESMVMVTGVCATCHTGA
ncbi:MAG: transcriptional repressor [Nitratiruptor sp.]|nr:transcriptional repressor [Nitratiruptor sp.]NPA83942.1 transcriptional repressor [Campylobacterota bacterium]